jgi:hypothetical protein
MPESRRQLSVEVQTLVNMMKAHNNVLTTMLSIPSIPIPLEQRQILEKDLADIKRLIEEIGS